MENRTEYIIPLTDVSNHNVSCGSEEDCDSASSYHSYGDQYYGEGEVQQVALNDENGDQSESSACSVASSASSASISIASNSESAHYADDDDDFDDDEESEEGSASSDGDDDYTGEEDEDATEDDDDDEDWGYKFFPDHDTRIRFSAEVEVHDTLTRDDYTAAEKMASFLTPKDKKAQWFYQNKAIAKLEWWLEETPEHRAKHVAEKDEKGDDKFIPRGLHQMTDKGYDRMNLFKNACVDAVLQEQEAQWIAAGRPTETGVLWNFERMAAVSMEISRGGAVESYKIAKRDEQQAQKAYRQIDRQRRDQQRTKKSKRVKSSQATTTAVVNNSSNSNNITKIVKTLHNHGGPPSPSLTTTPTTVTTTLTSSGSASNLESESISQQQQQRQREPPQQPLDYLEVASVESTPSLLTYMDDRSIVTPPSMEESSSSDVATKNRRMSLQEQQHPMLALHETHHQFMDLNSGHYKRRASAPPLRNQSSISRLQ